eukprot:m.636769 g.636769  ORF g.636769 m.636769 type:complete len:62 (+) comp22599_c0_seq6:3378-3563(+)
MWIAQMALLAIIVWLGPSHEVSTSVRPRHTSGNDATVAIAFATVWSAKYLLGIRHIYFVRQ